APSIGVDQSFQGLDQLGVMMDQRLSSGPRMPDSLNGEGALRKALDGPIDGRARKTSNTGDDGNTSSSQSLAIEGCNQVLLSLIEVRKQQGVLPLKFFGFAHSRILPSALSFVTLNFLLALRSCRSRRLTWTGRLSTPSPSLRQGMIAHLLTFLIEILLIWSPTVLRFLLAGVIYCLQQRQGRHDTRGVPGCPLR